MNLNKEKRNQILMWLIILLVISSSILFKQFWEGLALFVVGALVIVGGIWWTKKNNKPK